MITHEISEINSLLKKSSILTKTAGCYPFAPHRLTGALRSEEHTSELQSRGQLVCRLLLEKKTSHNRAVPRYPLQLTQDIKRFVIAAPDEIFVADMHTEAAHPVGRRVEALWKSELVIAEDS